MVWVPAGEFLYGVAETLTAGGYFMDIYEVGA
jgi:hypothetical protein